MLGRISAPSAVRNHDRNSARDNPRKANPVCAWSAMPVRTLFTGGTGHQQEAGREPLLDSIGGGGSPTPQGPEGFLSSPTTFEQTPGGKLAEKEAPDGSI
jgi:hypothetical protein